MTTPQRKSDAARDDAHAPRPSSTHYPLTRKLRPLLIFVSIFVAVYLLHLTLLDLPYYWDEAGYFIPAARDIYADGEFIPHSTLSNAHPPLVMALIALAWKLFGFHIAVARTAMLLVASLALFGTFRLAERVANARVAAATVLCTALYPVFFAQSALAHLDMMVAALTVWGLVFYLPPEKRRDGETGRGGDGETLPVEITVRGDAVGAFESRGVRRAASIALFALAALAKETAVLVPLTLFGWELLCLLAAKKEKLAELVCVERRRSFAWSLALLLACVPLALWFAYHRAQTGYTFGNPEYFRYNVESTLNLSRILETAWRRLAHVTAHMNLWALTLAGLAAMFLKPRRDRDGVERPRIAVPVQLLFAALILAHVVALSIVGGAVLARYMLPVLPLVVLVWVSTLWRRVPAWPLAVALVCAAFAYRTVVNPTYAFPWEENLNYRDFIVLHRDAARFLAARDPEARVLTTWPATDELKNPYFGYTDRALKVFAVENFKREALERAAQRKSEYDVALLFTTHGGLELEEARQLLGGRVVFNKEQNGQWVAVLDMRRKD
ncbi:MAG TPA: glycosyltransferase family 39 protein [Pyrinomonadaceae bacterium]|nr:glycosyltransferase family 39 protein [Pyrinomonadaceae bacterium]